MVHKRRGHLSIPRFKLGNGKRPVRDIRPRHPATHVRDPRLEYEQFDFDNFNVYARTEDNRFFFFDPPFITSRAIRFEFASCSFGGGVFRCPFFIKECDIYFKSGTDLDLGFFEDLPISTQKQSIAGHHKFCQGHDSNTWSHDLAGTMNREVTQQTFQRNNGPVWPREREEDAALYGVAGAAALKPPPSGPFILPKRNSVIDAGVKPPIEAADLRPDAEYGIERVSV